MADTITRTQVEAMDETLTYDFGQQAKAFADANRYLLADQAGVVLDQREAQLVRHISTQQRLLATAPLTPKQRRELEEAMELDDQELALRRDARAKKISAGVSRHAYWMAIGLLCIVGLVHFVAHNWSLTR